MNLAIDIGNSRIKLGLFQDGELLEHAVKEDLDELDLKGFFDDDRPIGVIVSSVRDRIPDPLMDQFPEKPLFLDQNTPLPIEVGIKDPRTIGPDRLANAVAAHSITPDKPVLVVDMGTCITYERIRDGILDGGAISPGIRMRAEAMHRSTGKLPEVQLGMDAPDRYGSDTETSLQAGIYYGVLDEIKGRVTAFQSDLPGGTVVLTGGDVPKVGKEFKKRTFADPFLTLRGLDKILRYQKEGATPDTGPSPTSS